MSTQEAKKSKMKTKKLPKSVNEMSKENLMKTLILKKECNSRALIIVERLIEPNVSEEFLLTSLKYINDTHYQDVVEERAIQKLCGYPICDQNIKEIPKKKYHICTRSNKVFDITERKNFCSNDCFKASQYLKEQMLSSPLWLREKEEIPQFKLFIKNTHHTFSGSGIEFDLEQKIQSKNENKCTDSRNSSDKDNKEEISISKKSKETDKPDDHNNSKKEASIQLKTKNNIVMEVVEKKHNISGITYEIVPEELKKEKKEILEETKTFGVFSIEKSLEEWFTLDSLCYLYGDEKVKKLLAEKGNAIKDFYQIINKAPWPNEYNKRYAAICRRLDILEINENRKDDADQQALKPLPDYRALQEESNQLYIKVKSFYEGKLEYPLENGAKNVLKQEKDQEEEEGTVLYLPLVDAHAQRALRRRLVLDRLNRVMDDLMSTFHLRVYEYSSLVKGLVGTFDLKASNITFQHQEWNILGLILLKMLSIKDERLKKFLEKESARHKMTLLLMGYNQSEGYLDRLMAWLTDIDRLFNLVNVNNVK